MGAAAVVLTSLIAPIMSLLDPKRQQQYLAVERGVNKIMETGVALKQELKELKGEEACMNTMLKNEDEQVRRRSQENFKMRIDGFQKKKAGLYKEFLGMVGELPRIEKFAKRSVAFLGNTSVGKSTWINKLFNTHAATSPLKCTKDITPVWNSPNLVVFDVFGTNDDETYHNTKLLMHTKRLHLIVAIYTESVESTFDFARLLEKLEVPVVFVRNKCDRHNTEELPMIQSNDERELKKRCSVFQKLILGSGTTGMGMKELMHHIRGSE